MSRQLPSLSALRAFEAAARHQSFTRAAIELKLTQTAISHRIRELESQLSVQLFVRKQNTTRLTEEGRTYLDCVRPALAQIAAATESVTSIHDNRLTIACLSGFATRCLMPALPKFREENPQFELRLTPLAASERLEQRDFDVAIWHGPDEWPGFDADRLSDERIFPVCVPALLEKGPPLKQPQDLRHYPIVRTVSPIITDDWPAWLQHVGCDLDGFDEEIYCESLSFSLNAMLAGLGIGIGRSVLVQADLAAGRLVAPFGTDLVSHAGYQVLSRPERSMLPKVRLFRQWLLEHVSGA